MLKNVFSQSERKTNIIRKWIKRIFPHQENPSESGGIKLEHTNHPGTGNSRVKIPMQELVRLNNTPITPEAAEKFVAFALKKIGSDKKVEVYFSSRKTSMRWGSVTRKGSRINLYRWSVWILIHELGHVLNPISLDGGGRRKVHCEQFARTTRMLHQIWKEFETSGPED